ncbi:MAG: HNH endonuclease [Defluviitaleaceae bacterium]|nr:HNH endonuclease [Defluviitaleaceae bacterium]
MDFQITKYTRSRTDEELLLDMKKVADANKGKLNVKIYRDYRKTVDSNIASCTTVHKQIGWSKAISLIGVQKTKFQNNSKTTEIELLNEILQLWVELGRRPTTRDIKERSNHHRGKFNDRFGSWGKALERFIEWANDENFVPPDSNILELNRRQTSRDVNLRLKYMILIRDNCKCRVCGKSPAINLGVEPHVDHIVPWSKGGETVIENLQTLCRDCNLGKSDLL